MENNFWPKQRFKNKTTIKKSMSEVKGLKEAEAVLFASGKAMEEDHIKELTNLKPKETRKALEALKQAYKERNTALFVWNEGTKWKINVKEDYIEIVKTLAAETELARAVLETLAVIAYRSPVLQSDVITARGSGAYDHISELVDKGFITKEKFGRSYKLKISDKFYHYFDVADGDIREALASAKQPDVDKIASKYDQKKLGSLDVVDALSDAAAMEEHRKETQVEIYNIEQQREDDKKHYLNDFESRLQETSERISDAERDILEQKEKAQEEQAAKEEAIGNDEAAQEADAPAIEETADDTGKEDDDDPQELVKHIEEEIDEITKKED